MRSGFNNKKDQTYLCKANHYNLKFLLDRLLAKTILVLVGSCIHPTIFSRS